MFGGKKRGKKSADAAYLPICTAYVVGYPSHFKTKPKNIQIRNRVKQNLGKQVLRIPCPKFHSPPLPLLYLYRERLKSFSVLLRMTQAAPGRNTRNLGKGI